ncbi:outer membrane protein assembly factor BamB [Undibacterium sp. Dicai25W]|uniref:outer membrane protein assembly factor BamB n=1 Tax=Undibacterium sp. Dicai25W TaxID=3413034 RepID=UPI003BF06721
MQFSAKLISVAAFCLLAGCSSLNPFASKPDPKKLPAPLVEIKSTIAVKQAWLISIGSSANYVFSPAVDGSSVYVAAADGTVAKIDAASGRSVWRINAGFSLTAGVGAGLGSVVVAGEKGNLFAFDTDGKLRWKVQESSEILSTPAIGAGLVVIRSNDNRISAYDLETGAKKWSVERPLPPLILRAVPGLLVVGDQVIVALPGGRMSSLALKNGGLRWEAVVGEPKGNTELERVADVSGLPVVVGKDVCATSYQGRVGCFDLNTGSPRWVKNISSEVGGSADERFMFASDSVGTVNAFNRDGGSSAWRNDKLARRRLSAPISFGRSVAVGDFEGYVHFLSREDGSFIGRVATDGSQILAAPIVVGSNLIVQTKSGSVVAFAAE